MSSQTSGCLGWVPWKEMLVDPVTDDSKTLSTRTTEETRLLTVYSGQMNGCIPFRVPDFGFFFFFRKIDLSFFFFLF